VRVEESTRCFQYTASPERDKPRSLRKDGFAGTGQAAFSTERWLRRNRTTRVPYERMVSPIRSFWAKVQILTKYTVCHFVQNDKTQLLFPAPAPCFLVPARGCHAVPLNLNIFILRIAVPNTILQTLNLLSRRIKNRLKYNHGRHAKRRYHQQFR